MFSLALACPQCNAVLHWPVNRPQGTCPHCGQVYEVLLKQGCVRLQPAVERPASGCFALPGRWFYNLIEPFPADVRTLISPAVAVAAVLALALPLCLIVVLMQNDPGEYPGALSDFLGLALALGTAAGGLLAGAAAYQYQSQRKHALGAQSASALKMWTGAPDAGQDEAQALRRLRELATQRQELEDTLAAGAPRAYLPGATLAWMTRTAGLAALYALPWIALILLTASNPYRRREALGTALVYALPLALALLLFGWRALKYGRARAQWSHYARVHAARLSQEWELWVEIQHLLAAYPALAYPIEMAASPAPAARRAWSPAGWPFLSALRALQIAHHLLLNPVFLFAVAWIVQLEGRQTAWWAYVCGLLPFGLAVEWFLRDLRSPGLEKYAFESRNLLPLEVAAPEMVPPIRALEDRCGQPAARLYWTASGRIPHVFGQHHPAVLVVPEKACRPPEKLESLLLHEYAHLAQKHPYTVRPVNHTPLVLLAVASLLGFVFLARLGRPEELPQILGLLAGFWITLLAWRFINRYVLHMRSHLAEYAADRLAAAWAGSPDGLIEAISGKYDAGDSPASATEEPYPMPIPERAGGWSGLGRRLLHSWLQPNDPLYRYLWPLFNPQPRPRDRMVALKQAADFPAAPLASAALGLAVIPLATLLSIFTWQAGFETKTGSGLSLPLSLVLVIGYFIFAAGLPALGETATGLALATRLVRQGRAYFASFLAGMLLVLPITALAAFYAYTLAGQNRSPYGAPPYFYPQALFPDPAWLLLPVVWAGLGYLAHGMVRAYLSVYTPTRPADKEIFLTAALGLVGGLPLIVELLWGGMRWPLLVILFLEGTLVWGIGLATRWLPLEKVFSLLLGIPANRCPACNAAVPGPYTPRRCCPQCGVALNPWLAPEE